MNRVADLKVLVTGGAGFIASYLVDKLIREGCEVTVLDDLSSGLLENIGDHVAKDDVEFVEGSILDRKVVAQAVHGVDAVVHLAAVVSVPFSVLNPERTYEVNVYGTKVLLDQCVSNGVEKFVFASSCAVYGEASYLPIDEVHPTDPLSPYAESKLVTEQMCVKDYGSRLGMVALRLFNVYGQGQAYNGYAGVITAFAKCLEAREPLIIFGDGFQTRDFIHVSDVARAVWLTLTRADAGGIFNIASGRAVRIRELAEIMADIADVEDLQIDFEKPREGDVRHSHGDYSEARRVLGYVPEKDLREGLQELLTEKTVLVERVSVY